MHKQNAAAVDPAGMRVIWLLLTAAFVAILNETTMAIAIPELNATLGIPPSLGQWMTSAFMLTMAVVIPTTGFLLQRFTTRQVFISAISLFNLGTLICLLAPGFTTLLLGRVVQAGGTGIMMPLLMTTIMNVVPAHSRGRMMGRVGMVISLAPALGPTMSGVILDHLGWRWIFGIILPIGLISLSLGLKWMTNLGESNKAPIDVLSVVLSALAFGGIVYGLSQFGGGHGGESAAGGSGAGTEAGMNSAATAWIVIAVGLLMLGLFIWRQLHLQKTDRALLDLRVFKSRTYVLAVTIMTVIALTMFGVLSLLPLYLQTVVGLGATQSGLVMLPGSIMMGLLGPVMGRIYDARGPRVLLIPGTMLVATALLLYTLVAGKEVSAIVLALIQSMMSVGLAGSFTPLFSASLGSLQRRFYSYGSAVLNTVQQVGGAAGTAVLISIYALSLREEARGQTLAQMGAQGAHNAFMLAMGTSLVAVVLSFFVRKPADEENAAEVVAVDGGGR